MSHNSGGAISPYISTGTPAVVGSAGNTTFTIDGNRFSDSMVVNVPSGLGSLVSTTITHTATTSQAVIVINVAEHSSPTYHNITLSNGGESSSNSVFTVQAGVFLVESLLTTERDFYLNAGMSSGVADDSNIPAVIPEWGGSGANTRDLTQINSAYQCRYFDAVSAVNNQPALKNPTNLTSGKYGDGNSGDSPYLFSPKDTAFTLGVVWKPLAATSQQRFASLPNDDAYRCDMQSDTNEIAVTFNGAGTTASYTNQNTVDTRYLLIYGGGGDDVTVKEPTTGLDFTYTITGTATGTTTSPADYMIYVKNGYLLEWIKLEYALNAAQRTMLMTSWQNKYEV